MRKARFLVVVLAVVGCNKSTSTPADEDKRLDRALAQKRYGSLMLFLKDHPKSPRAAEARKAADAIVAEAIKSYHSTAKTKGAKGADPIKEALEWLHQNQRQALFLAYKHHFPNSVKTDTTGKLRDQFEHGYQLSESRLREIVTRLSSALGHRTKGAFRIAKSSAVPQTAKEPTLVLRTELAESDKPMVTNKGTFARLELKLALRLLWPGKEPISILDEVVGLPEGFNVRYGVRVRPGETLDQKDPTFHVYHGMRKRLWERVASKVYGALALGSP